MLEFWRENPLLKMRVLTHNFDSLSNVQRNFEMKRFEKFKLKHEKYVWGASPLKHIFQIQFLKFFHFNVSSDIRHFVETTGMCQNFDFQKRCFSSRFNRFCMKLRIFVKFGSNFKFPEISTFESGYFKSRARNVIFENFWYFPRKLVNECPFFLEKTWGH